MDGVSIVVCCYNSRGKLRPTLEHLTAQKTHNIPFEIIIIDNNSSDGTSLFANNILSEYSTPFKIVKETKPGLRFAREKGIESSQHGVIIFCDDDNYLSDDYVYRVYSLFLNDEDMALVGGMGTAVSDVAFPDWFYPYQGLYAVGRPVSENGTLPLGLGYVYGAGMAMKKSAWNKLAGSGFSTRTTDRKGKLLSGGHDVELSHAFRLIGYKVVFDDTLQFKHYIEENRLTKKYLLALTKGSSASFITFIYYLIFQRNVSTIAGFSIAYIKRIISDYLASKSKDEMISVMNRSSFYYLLRNFFPALSYFRHVIKTYQNR